MKLRENEVRTKHWGQIKEGYTSNIKWIFMLALLLVITIVVPNGKMAHAEEIGDLTSDGYSFDTDTKKLTIATDNGVTAWRRDTKIAKAEVRSVEMRDGIKKIGNQAFYYCIKLEEVIIPESVTSIESNAFAGCSSLEEVTIPESVTSIGEEAFYECSSLREVTIPESVTSIGEAAFYQCSSLRKVTIPEGVTSIEPSTFFWCSSLEEIEIPEGVTSIGSGAFRSCIFLRNIEIPKGVTTIEDYTFYGCNFLGTIEIPEGVTSIGKYAFTATGFRNVEIPEKVTSIGASAFEKCGSLNEVTIQSNIVSIDNTAFNACKRLSTVTVPNGTITVTANLYYAGSVYIIPNSVTNFSITEEPKTGFEFSEWEGSDTSAIDNLTNSSITYEMLSAGRDVTFCANYKLMSSTVAIVESVDGNSYTSSGKRVSLKKGDSTKTGANNNGTWVFVDVLEGVYSICIDDVDTGRVINKTDAVAVNDTLDFYTIKFAVSDEGSAKGSTISATYDSTEITSGTVVLGGKKLIITVVGSGNNNYTWSGTGVSGNTDKITKDALAETVDANCVVTDKSTSTPDPTPSTIPTETTEAEPVVISAVDMVRVTPSVVTVIQGKTKSFTAKVIGTEDASKDVTWSVEGNTSSSTVVSADGVLTVGKDEKATSIIVKATSKEDNTKSAYATVKVVAKKGTTFTAGNYTYIITDDSFDGTGTVTLTGVAKGKTVTTVNVPETAKYKGIEYDVTAIGEKAFYQNKNIKKATIGNNVTVIGKNSFRECP
uniref:leucine-rich repeat protein n=1 Tax=Anaerosporobacter sp. TaxID=1872529 RepID=UPI00286F054A